MKKSWEIRNISELGTEATPTYSKLINQLCVHVCLLIMLNIGCTFVFAQMGCQDRKSVFHII